MARFDWTKARTPRQSWAYHPAAPRRHSREEWQIAAIRRQIRALTDRIINGKSWLQTIPTADPNHAKWSAIIADLKLQRAQLAKTLPAATE